VYHEELRRRLTDRLGVEWGPDRHGCRDSALDEIDTFTNGIRTAQAELSRREQSVEYFGPKSITSGTGTKNTAGPTPACARSRPSSPI
jgi:hypothetical protein